MKHFMYALFAGIVITVLVTGYFSQMEKDLSDNLLRLHIVANSNSEKDQQIKLKIRDEIVNRMGDKLSKYKGVQDIKNNIDKHIPEIESIANKVLYDEGFKEKAKAKFVTCNIPQKSYKNITLPKGTYDALKVEIGDAKGENWWCVMYPPLCFVDCTKGEMTPSSDNMLKSSLKSSGYNMITDNSSPVKVKFKLYELWQDSKKFCNELFKNLGK